MKYRIFLSAVFGVILSLPLAAAERVALVIGNNTYENAGVLENPVNDAKAVGERLRAAGYDVTMLSDATVRDMHRGLRGFCEQAREAESAVFFYAGHGVEVKGENYLLPVDAKLAEEADLDLEAISLKKLMQDMGETETRLKLIVLDCCRNDPFGGGKARSWMKRSRSAGGGGLAEVAEKQLAEGTMIVFSAAPGTEASDGEDGHSPFTSALLKEMGTPGASMATVFSQVAVAVADQEPWIRFDGSGKSLAAFSTYALVPGEAPSASTPVPAMPTVPGSARSVPVLDKGKVGDSRTFSVSNGEKVIVRYIPGGEFLMGSPEDEVDRVKDENQVTVTLTSHFWMAETEVTQALWKEIIGVNPSAFTDDPLQPVEQVSWEDVQVFLEKLNAKGGLAPGWRWGLPSEAQWERACRGGVDTPFAHGADLDANQANFDGSYPYGKGQEVDYWEQTTTVKDYEPNQYGLYDMHGNVHEWCSDWYSEVQPGGIDPLGEEAADYRAYRGGSWYTGGSQCRSASRWGNDVTTRDNDLGFRLALVRVPGTPTVVADAMSLDEGEIGDSRTFPAGGEEAVTVKFVPGGEFVMGSPEKEESRKANEGQVTVMLSSHFWMAETEVTQALWLEMMGSNPSMFPDDPQNPVEQVSWDDAQVFLEKLNTKGGLPKGWRWALPTEAQWERACRGGVDTPFSTGSDFDATQANFDGILPYGQGEDVESLDHPTAVKSYKPNQYGLYDMHGNVEEWCSDGYQETLPGGVDPTVDAASETGRVYRGGSWFDGGAECRSASRDGRVPTVDLDTSGLRLALVPVAAE